MPRPADCPPGSPGSLRCWVTSQHVEAWAPRPTRPRSWWSWAMPNRSASRITITVALGTSTPTSITVVATSTSSSPARNESIVASFSTDVSRPCSNPSRSPASSSLAQPLEGLLCRCHLELLALADQRTHDVGLAARRRPGAHVGPHLGLEQRPLGPLRDDRRATGREFVEHAHVEIAVDRHRRGPRDRCRRHHQHVGHGAADGLGPQCRSLLDAEAVLLVDDDDTEAGEVDGVLDQCVGADRRCRPTRRPDRRARPCGRIR